MKKKIKPVCIILLAVILVFLLWPRRFFLTDGGSYGYASALYKITFYNPSEELYPDAEKCVYIKIMGLPEIKR